MTAEITCVTTTTQASSLKICPAIPVTNTIGRKTETVVSVEAIIGGAQKARVQVETRGGLQPILSLESQLTSERRRELIAAGEDRILNATIPAMGGKRALEMGEGPVRFLSHLLHKGAAFAVGMEAGGKFGDKQRDASRGAIVRGSFSALPFAENAFDYITARLATSLQGNVVRILKEVGRVLSPGGQGVVIDFHPFGLYAKSGAERERAIESPVVGLADYYKLSRSAGLRVVDVREVFVDEQMRSHFPKEEIGAYRNLKGTPLMIFLYIYKPRKRAG